MINILPPEEKKQLRAARSNSLLIRYNILLVGVFVFLALAIGFVYIYLSSTKTAAENLITENKTKVASYDDVAEEAADFRKNLQVAKQILDREVTYTDAVVDIAQAIPSGVVFDNLSLDASTFGTERTITAHAKSYGRALALKDAFQKSDLFSNVHFQSITTGGSNGDSSSSSAPGYPVSVTLNVTINKKEEN